jgi:hypothetical protein
MGRLHNKSPYHPSSGLRATDARRITGEDDRVVRPKRELSHVTLGELMGTSLDEGCFNVVSLKC